MDAFPTKEMLPPGLARIARVVGVDAALRIAEAEGGRYCTLPEADQVDDDHWLAALIGLAASAAPDPAQFVPIGELERAVQEVNRLNKGITAAAAVQHVELQINAGSLPPALRAWGVSLCTVNKTAFDSFVERTRGAFNPLFDKNKTRKAESGHRPAALDDEELAVCRRMGITPDELVAARAFTGNETMGA